MSERQYSMATNRIVAFLRQNWLWQFGARRQESSAASESGRLSRVNVGDRVRICSGPLVDVEGTVVACRRRRLVVSVLLIQSGVTIELDDDLVDAIV